MPLLRPMTAADYDAFIALLRSTPGVTVRDADLRAATERYLARNPGLSFVALDGEQLAGCALCGHDGRRGYLQHVVVDLPYRGRGLAQALVEQCLRGLDALGIHKTHIDVLADNPDGLAYWRRRGWQLRTDIHRLSLTRQGGDNV